MYFSPPAPPHMLLESPAPSPSPPATPPPANSPTPSSPPAPAPSPVRSPTPAATPPIGSPPPRASSPKPSGQAPSFSPPPDSPDGNNDTPPPPSSSKVPIVGAVVGGVVGFFLLLALFYYLYDRKRKGKKESSSLPLSSEPRKERAQVASAAAGGGKSSALNTPERPLVMEREPLTPPRTSPSNVSTVAKLQVHEQGGFRQSEVEGRPGQRELVADKTSARLSDNESHYVSPSAPNKTFSPASDEPRKQPLQNMAPATGMGGGTSTTVSKLERALEMEQQQPSVAPPPMPPSNMLNYRYEEKVTTTQGSSFESTLEQGMFQQFKAERGPGAHEFVPNKMSAHLPEEKRPYDSPSTPNKTMSSASDEILTTTQSSAIARIHEQQGVSRQLKAEGGQKERESMPNKLLTRLPEEKRPYDSPSTPNKILASASDEILTTTQSSTIASIHEQQGVSQRLKTGGGQKERESVPDKTSAHLPEEKRPYVSPSTPNKTLAFASDGTKIVGERRQVNLPEEKAKADRATSASHVPGF